MPTTESPSQALEAALRKPDKYQRDIAAGLDKAFNDDNVEEVDLDLKTARVIIFSDHHKGARDGADDFQRAERAYNAALGYYLEQGFQLFVLGDVEELWECKPEEVLDAYEDTLKLEAEFHRAGRYQRFWGNHDDDWRYDDAVAKHLEPFFPRLRVHEALKVTVSTNGEGGGLLFLVHGHQGTADSDRFAWFSRTFVRYGWRNVQRKWHLSATTPAIDYELRHRHDAAMYAWARKHPAKPVLIAGHTHHPIFGKSKPEPKVERTPEQVEHELEAARPPSDEKAKEKVALLRAELEFTRAELRGQQPPPLPIEPPCYFNSGCCSFGDGDVTGIEISEGELRLVRWPDDDGKPLPKLLAPPADLGEVLQAVGNHKAVRIPG